MTCFKLQFYSRSWPERKPGPQGDAQRPAPRLFRDRHVLVEAPSDLGRSLYTASGSRGRARAPGLWRGDEAAQWGQWGAESWACGPEEEVPDKPQRLDA